MKNGRGFPVGLLLLLGSFIMGGCVDALRVGAATGLADGIAAFVEGLITRAGDQVVPEE